MKIYLFLLVVLSFNVFAEPPELVSLDIQIETDSTTISYNIDDKEVGLNTEVTIFSLVNYSNSEQLQYSIESKEGELIIDHNDLSNGQWQLSIFLVNNNFEFGDYSTMILQENNFDYIVAYIGGDVNDVDGPVVINLDINKNTFDLNSNGEVIVMYSVTDQSAINTSLTSLLYVDTDGMAKNVNPDTDNLNGNFTFSIDTTITGIAEILSISFTDIIGNTTYIPVGELSAMINNQVVVVNQDQDIESELTSFDFIPKTLSNGENSSSVVFNLNIDNVTFENIFDSTNIISFENNNTIKSVHLDKSYGNLIGTFTEDLEDGVWTIIKIQYVDINDNVIVYDTNELIAKGFPTTLTVGTSSETNTDASITINTYDLDGSNNIFSPYVPVTAETSFILEESHVGQLGEFYIVAFLPILGVNGFFMQDSNGNFIPWPLDSDGNLDFTLLTPIVIFDQMPSTYDHSIIENIVFNELNNLEIYIYAGYYIDGMGYTYNEIPHIMNITN